MSIDYPLLSLDILGATNDVSSDNCILKENKTTLLSRGSLAYNLASRNETLQNRGYRTPEDWDFSWTKTLGSIWSPQVLIDDDDSANPFEGNVETWVLPEYFRPEESDTSRCIEATSRAGNTVLRGFENQLSSLANMPELVRDSSLRNHEALVLDGNTSPMRGGSLTMWDVGTADFILACVIKPDLTGNVLSHILAKKTDSQFVLSMDLSGSNRDIIFTMNSNNLTVTNGLIGTYQIITCGRMDGKAFLNVNNGYDLALSRAATEDLANLDVSNKPWLGDRYFSNDEYEGSILEIILLNEKNALSPTISDDVRDKLEGYLAWKYQLESKLHTTHTYKSKPPRASLARKE
jgi:hypothetical protein